MEIKIFPEQSVQSQSDSASVLLTEVPTVLQNHYNKTRKSTTIKLCRGKETRQK